MRRRWIALSLCGTLLCSASGCLFVNHSTRIVRDKEPLRTVQFESDQAKQYFLGGVHELQAHKESSDVKVSAVPFLWWHSSASALSDNAIYNDQITVCDVNGDNRITLQEALVYRANVAQRGQTQEAKTAASAPKSEPPAPSPEIKPASNAEPPPALIHISTRNSSP